MFTPVAENIKSDYFINNRPENIIRSGNVTDLPWTVGVVSDEGLLVTKSKFNSNFLKILILAF